MEGLDSVYAKRKGMMQLRKYRGKRRTSWIIDYTGADGKRKRFVLKGIESEKSAELAFADFRLRFERQQIGLPTEENISIGDAFDLLYKDRELAGCSQGWLTRIDYMGKAIMSFFGEDQPFKSLTEEQIARFRVHRLHQKKKAETVNKELKIIVAAGRVMLKQGKIGKLPWTKVNFAVDRSGREAWSFIKEDEASRLLNLLRHGGKCTIKRCNERKMTFDFTPRPRLWAMITFMLNTGARVGEMFSVQWNDIDMENKVVRLIGSKSARSGKPAKPRYITMNEALEELFSVLPRGNEREVVFKRDENINRDFDHALKCAGLPHYRIHDLRHSFASALAMQGVPLYTISALLGHATVQMTQRYAHLAPDSLGTAVQKLRFKSSSDKPPSV